MKKVSKTNKSNIIFPFFIVATTIFMNGFFSFMLSLATVYKLGAPVSPILLR